MAGPEKTGKLVSLLCWSAMVSWTKEVVLAFSTFLLETPEIKPQFFPCFFFFYCPIILF